MKNDTLLSHTIRSLEDKTATIGIVGLGYVGLPLALRYSSVGYQVLGFDIDPVKVRKLNAGRSYIGHISDDRVKAARRKGFRATSDFALISKVKAAIICVPTPLNKFREPDLSFVVNTVAAIVPHLRSGQVLSLESTTYPGTTDEEIAPRVEKRGFTVGKDVFVVHSPEREDPGNPHFNTQTIPKIVGGCTPNCLKAGLALYGKAIDKLVPVSSTQAAELTKLLENIHRAINIGLANEMKIVADRMGIDIHEVIRAAASKPFGFTPYYPGPGIGGHCIPIDPFYLTWKARQFGVNTHFIELAGEVNAGMPAWVVGKINQALNQKNKAVKNSRILILGIAYKRDVDDMRESPSVFIMEILRDLGAKISYSDPHVPVFPKMREHHFNLKSVPLTAKNLASFDCVVLASDHRRFDYDLIKKHARLIVDTRGVFLEKSPKVVKA